MLPDRKLGCMIEIILFALLIVWILIGAPYTLHSKEASCVGTLDPILNRQCEGH